MISNRNSKINTWTTINKKNPNLPTNLLDFVIRTMHKEPTSLLPQSVPMCSSDPTYKFDVDVLTQKVKFFLIL